MRRRSQSRRRREERRLIEQYLSSGHPQKLQLGCGMNVLPGWLNSDRVAKADGVIIVEANRRFPFGDSTFDYVFSEHMIEHLEYGDGLVALRECFRVLRPGGKVRIATPDIRFLFNLYGSAKSDLESRYVAWVAARFLREISVGANGDVFVINNFLRSFGHRFIYDPATLAGALRASGFSGITVQNVGESDDGELRNIESHGSRISEEFNRLETFVIEGLKEAD